MKRCLILIIILAIFGLTSCENIKISLDDEYDVEITDDIINKGSDLFQSFYQKTKSHIKATIKLKNSSTTTNLYQLIKLTYDNNNYELELVQKLDSGKKLTKKENYKYLKYEKTYQAPNSLYAFKENYYLVDDDTLTLDEINKAYLDETYLHYFLILSYQKKLKQLSFTNSIVENVSLYEPYQILETTSFVNNRLLSLLDSLYYNNIKELDDPSDVTNNEEPLRKICIRTKRTLVRDDSHLILDPFKIGDELDLTYYIDLNNKEVLLSFSYISSLYYDLYAKLTEEEMIQIVQELNL